MIVFGFLLALLLAPLAVPVLAAYAVFCIVRDILRDAADELAGRERRG